MLDLYLKSTCFIFPTLSEGSPSVLGEALSFGLPIIATKNRGHNSLINHGRNGYLYENNNPISFCQGALNLIQSKDTYNQISKNNISDSKIYSQEFIDIDQIPKPQTFEEMERIHIQFEYYSQVLQFSAECRELINKEIGRFIAQVK